ncbi:peptidase C15, pyroglutamyl peptidase I-like protein [Trichodelitschia bisporula]|uniref:Peptidase C15, pyroglutamyl peptidase I-like protein n=1 Tax=Trichodelitschia bisporula TaxID=703511 RepID=A0A6G1HVK9_9PEZI|nr:peptidase C15, pyroglutamyl peptidase I-like protein [Trichodelitschia bisporula]
MGDLIDGDTTLFGGVEGTERDGGVETMLPDVHVLVTGYGPFLKSHPENPSWSIASSLPSHLKPTPTHPTPIHIHTPESALPVAWRAIANAVPGLLAPAPPASPPDIVLHMGLAAGRTCWAIETNALRDGFDGRDVYGEQWSDADMTALIGTDAPEKLTPTFDCQDVCKRWQAEVRGAGLADRIDAQISDDVGTYLCAFVYYLSLHHFWKAGGERPVVFFHVPRQAGEDVEAGVGATVGLIRSLVESRRVQRDRRRD